MFKNVSNCARCGDDHRGVVFEQLDNPVSDADGAAWDYWAACPNNGQPILLREDPEPETR